jgi:transcriptional regulator with XRE-family HTH domain
METLFDIQDLGREVAKLRRKQGLSQSDIAARAGVSRAMISDLENGQLHDPGVRKVLRVLKVLGMGVRVVSLSPPTLDELLSNQEESDAY